MAQNGRAMSRRALIAGAAASTVMPAAAFGQAFAGRNALLMVDDPACVYCRKWMREVSQGYQASAEGRAFPLVRRNRGHADLAGFQGVIYTPTFLVLAKGREAGRIVGYTGADFFWADVERIITSVAGAL
jgi:hypothetical protein